MRLRASGASARSGLASAAASPKSFGRRPSPYMSATSTTYLSPAIRLPRSTALSVMPIQFGAISTAGRGRVTLSS